MVAFSLRLVSEDGTPLARKGSAMIYLDTSAVVKLILPEAETAALEDWITARAGTTRVSSRLLRIELMRTTRRNAPDRLERALLVLSDFVLVSMDDVSAAADTIGHSSLRSLDAIHLATAHRLRGVLTWFVAYDSRMLESAKALGLPVATPA